MVSLNWSRCLSLLDCVHCHRLRSLPTFQSLPLFKSLLCMQKNLRQPFNLSYRCLLPSFRWRGLTSQPLISREEARLRKLEVEGSSKIPNKSEASIRSHFVSYCRLEMLKKVKKQLVEQWKQEKAQDKEEVYTLKQGLNLKGGRTQLCLAFLISPNHSLTLN